MKKHILLIIVALLCAVQFSFAQKDWAIVDGTYYTQHEFDSLIVVLKKTALDTTRTSITKYTGRPDKCLCIEFHFMTIEGPQFTRDCGDIYEIHFSSKNGILDIIRENNKIDSYWVYDPFTWLPIQSMRPKYVDIFEINRDVFSQGQKPWLRYSDGTPFE